MKSKNSKSNDVDKVMVLADEFAGRVEARVSNNAARAALRAEVERIVAERNTQHRLREEAQGVIGRQYARIADLEAGINDMIEAGRALYASSEARLKAIVAQQELIERLLMQFVLIEHATSPNFGDEVAYHENAHDLATEAIAWIKK